MEDSLGILGFDAGGASGVGSGVRNRNLEEDDDELGAGGGGGGVGGRGVCAQVLTGAGRKEATRECALEACRILDKLGELDPNKTSKRIYLSINSTTSLCIHIMQCYNNLLLLAM